MVDQVNATREKHLGDECGTVTGRNLDRADGILWPSATGRDGAPVAPPLVKAQRRLWKTHGLGGRLRTSLTEKLRKARERSRAYRERRKAAHG
jgi:hypothetical protein